MKKIISKDIFIKIFKRENYRKKLDEIILNFFGLTTHSNDNSFISYKKCVSLEFIVFINTEYVLKIVVKDTKNLFKTPKKFYINLSYSQVDRHHTLLMPCYWEIYCPYCLKKLKNNPQILLIAALLYCKTKEEVKNVLNKIKIFNKTEIANIMNIIEMNN